MKLKDKSRNIKKLLEYKSNSYKRKYFILSSLFNSDVLNSERLSEEFNCYVNSLNYSNGVYPDESDLISFYQECLQYSNTSRKLIESKVRFIKNVDVGAFCVELWLKQVLYRSVIPMSYISILDTAKGLPPDTFGIELTETSKPPKDTNVKAGGRQTFRFKSNRKSSTNHNE